MSYLDRIRACSPPDFAAYRPFRVDGVSVGRVRHGFAERLRAFAEVFRVGADAVDLAPALIGYAERTRAVDRVLRRLAVDGLIRGWRDENYPVGTAFAQPPVFEMERAAIPLFGVRAYGVHMNGFVGAGGALRMWIGRRSLSKPTAPGKLDQLVAGGQPAGISLRDNLVKECAEEAGIPAELAGRAIAVGAVTYCTERPEGLRNDVLFIYDLELPADFRPVNADGEIVAFYLWPIAEVAAVVRDSDAFKFNCALVVIDFLIRHGLIEADHPDYVELTNGLRR